MLSRQYAAEHCIGIRRCYRSQKYGFIIRRRLAHDTERRLWGDSAPLSHYAVVKAEQRASAKSARRAPKAELRPKAA